MALELIMKEARGMTDEALMEVVHYMRYLKIARARTEAPISDSAQDGGRIYRKPGYYHGVIKISEDFDAPLDDFKEYM